MKKIKFAPELVPLILNGEKTATWRLFDDKDLQAGDELLFIDRGTNIPFALAVIDKSFEKPLGQLSQDDKKGHERYESDEKMYQTFKGYYQREVNAQTLVKIVHFTLTITPLKTSRKEEMTTLANEYLAQYYGDQADKLNDWLAHNFYKYAWLKIINNKITAWIVLVIDPDKSDLKISSLCVAKEYRSQGIGTELMNFALESAKYLKKNKVWLTVNSLNTLSQTFVEKYSFKKAKEVENMYLPNQTEFIYELLLD